MEIVTWVRNKVNLIEIGQYSIFGHILLDSLLRKVIGKLNFEISSTKDSYKNLEDSIELLNKTILASNVYMEELQTGINNILRAGSLSFINTLERHWRLDKIEQNNRKKLESLNAQRSSFEQTLISYKQDRMNTVSTAFTGMGIAAVIAAVVTLNPLKSWIIDHRSNLPQYDEIYVFIILTILTIVITIWIIWKWKSIRNYLSSKANSFRKGHVYSKRIKEQLNANSQDERERCKQELGKIRREVRDSFDKSEISGSQYDKLRNRINRQMANEIIYEIDLVGSEISYKKDKGIDMLGDVILQDSDKEVLKIVLTYLYSKNSLPIILENISGRNLLRMRDLIPITYDYYFNQMDQKVKSNLVSKMPNRVE